MARIGNPDLPLRPQGPSRSLEEEPDERPSRGREQADNRRMRTLRADLQSLEQEAPRAPTAPGVGRSRGGAVERDAPPSPQGPPARKMSQAEAERFFSQAGFSRLQRKRGKGIELDHVTEGPIPLPLDEVDEGAWDQGSLDEAQEKIADASGQLGSVVAQVADSATAVPGNAGLMQALTASGFAPTEADIARLTALQEAPEQPEPSLDAARAHLREHFGVDLSAVEGGPTLLACALVVGGLAAAVQVQDGGLRQEAFAGGMHTLMERSQQAVGDARVMSSGISKQRAVQRTLILKR